MTFEKSEYGQFEILTSALGQGFRRFVYQNEVYWEANLAPGLWAQVGPTGPASKWNRETLEKYWHQSKAGTALDTAGSAESPLFADLLPA